MFKNLLLLNIFIYVFIHIKYINCAPRYKRISNGEIQNETKIADLSDLLAMEKLIKINYDVKKNDEDDKQSDGNIKTVKLNKTTPNKNIKLDNIKEDKNKISVPKKFKPDFEVILLDNIPTKLQDISPLYKILNDYEWNSYEQNNNLLPKWHMPQQNKSPNKKTFEIANMLFGLDELSSMDDSTSEYVPLKKKFNPMFRELDMSQFTKDRYCPIHITSKSLRSEKAKDLNKKPNDYMKICTCRVFEKPTK